MFTVWPGYHPILKPSSQTSRPEVAPVFRPAAVIVTGEETVEPFTGAQMRTPGLDGIAQPPPPPPPLTVKSLVPFCDSPLIPMERTSSRCEPGVTANGTLMVSVAYQPTLWPSSHTSKPAVFTLLVPAAEVVIGDVTVEPFTGEQMFTPADEGRGHVPPPPPLPTVTLMDLCCSRLSQPAA